MTERELVRALGPAETRLGAMRGLVGGVTATELRAVTVTEPVFRALAEGVGDPDPKVRWWSIQLLDHVADPGRSTSSSRRCGTRCPGSGATPRTP